MGERDDDVDGSFHEIERSDVVEALSRVHLFCKQDFHKVADDVWM